jgi:hypothetical protein
MKKIYLLESERNEILSKYKKNILLEEQNYTLTDLQNKLIQMGISVGATGADGKFGPNTLGAIEKALGTPAQGAAGTQGTASTQEQPVTTTTTQPQGQPVTTTTTQPQGQPVTVTDIKGY